MKDLIRVSVIIPTYNERENLPLLISGLQEIMKGHSLEIVVVDDNSEDGTWRTAKGLSLENPNLHLI